ncbi:hypothetical protein G8770_10555 [Aestuariicella hydrocarbonica]|uniref:Uncharacterized protein n=1 Tax=Pseudomaricurvus hydrocarbonicus TaxID=1470433 RepID=A0A9E5JUT1_9GAMM|nr:hypothetical protein [Aestuariicella hydrocarbonica]NHO65983.1 hypothetical protein [Aestuariicella hydrocarbonica]
MRTQQFFFLKRQTVSAMRDSLFQGKYWLKLLAHSHLKASNIWSNVLFTATVPFVAEKLTALALRIDPNVQTEEIAGSVMALVPCLEHR